VSTPSESSIRKRSNCNIVARIRPPIATGSRERGICQRERRRDSSEFVSCLFANDLEATPSRSCLLWVNALTPYRYRPLAHFLASSMSALGQKQTLRCFQPMSALPPESGHRSRRRKCPLCANSRHWATSRRCSLYLQSRHPCPKRKGTGTMAGPPNRPH
jgi:hypothetical protein